MTDTDDRLREGKTLEEHARDLARRLEREVELYQLAEGGGMGDEIEREAPSCVHCGVPLLPSRHYGERGEDGSREVTLIWAPLDDDDCDDENPDREHEPEYVPDAPEIESLMELREWAEKDEDDRRESFDPLSVEAEVRVEVTLYTGGPAGGVTFECERGRYGLDWLSCRVWHQDWFTSKVWATVDDATAATLWELYGGEYAMGEG